jgi:hypothetical protein
MRSSVGSPCREVAALAASLLLATLAVRGSAETDEPEPDPWVPVAFVIVRSTPDYGQARSVAERAAAQLAVPLNLRGLVYDPAHGLTWPKEECDKDPLYPFPCYVARGRFDPGVYISVERSDAYESFRPGLFVVIAASGEPGSAEVASSLTKARAAYPDAYIKEEKVYHGCMH